MINPIGMCQRQYDLMLEKDVIIIVFTHIYKTSIGNWNGEALLGTYITHDSMECYLLHYIALSIAFAKFQIVQIRDIAIRPNNDGCRNDRDLIDLVPLTGTTNSTHTTGRYGWPG